MRLSEKRKSELYRVISNEIMKVRIKLSMKNGYVVSIDESLHELEIDIWNKVKKTLNIKGK